MTIMMIGDDDDDDDEFDEDGDDAYHACPGPLLFLCILDDNDGDDNGVCVD